MLHLFRRQIILFLASFWLAVSLSPALSQPPPTDAQWAEQARSHYLSGDFPSAIAALNRATAGFRDTQNWSKLAIALTNLGQLQLTIGQPELALNTWQEAIDLYAGVLNQSSALPRLHLYRAHAYAQLGLYPLACRTTTTALNIDPVACEGEVSAAFANLPVASDELIWRGWQELAEIWRFLGQLEASRALLETLSDRLPNSPAKDTVLLSWANTLKALGDRERDRLAVASVYRYLPWQCEVVDLPERAANYYQQADRKYREAADSTSPIIQTRASLDRFSLLKHSGNLAAIASVGNVDIARIPLGRERIYARIDRAKTEACAANLVAKSPAWDELAAELQTAISEAQRIGDRRALAYAWGNLGGLFEVRSRLESSASLAQDALKFTREALYLAQPEAVPELAYQWQWQQGRLLVTRGEIAEAIASYNAAVKTLEKARADLLAIDSDFQLSFRDEVEPLYRQAIDLLLSGKTVDAIALEQALSLVDSLQQAELENFLDCDLSESVQVEGILEELDPRAAFISPIVLEDRIEVIYKLPQHPLAHHSQPLNHREVEILVRRLQQNLTQLSREEETLADARRLYDWIMRPLEPQLQQQTNLKTLVFVSDGILRTIPPALFYDGERFAIEQYEIALLPTRQLFDPRPRQQSLRVLAAGIGEAQNVDGIDFAPLPFVENELELIQERAVAKSKPLVNEAFTEESLASAIDTARFPTVHIATHGEFGSEPEETYILAWGERISLNELAPILQIADRSPSGQDAIELLVLSACETAKGNRRAALGLAGVAAKARVRTTVATLWQVDDLTTASLMVKFYEGLSEGKTIATALREAQLYILEDLKRRLPLFWAPFVIVGNWL